MQVHPHSCRSLFIVTAIAAIGCSPGEPEAALEPSPVVPFDELFIPHDTVRLDPSVLIGNVESIDVGPNAELLISDRSGEDIHLFSADGKHALSYSKDECLPEESGMSPLLVRFIQERQIMVLRTGTGAAAVFDSVGTCLSAIRHQDNFTRASCANRDTIFVQNTHVQSMPVTMDVYTDALTRIGTVRVVPPRLPRLNQVHIGQVGRTLACFEDGPYFVYAESEDAIAVDSEITRYRPEFFEYRNDDLQAGPNEGFLPGFNEDHTETVAIFALNPSTRMIVMTNLDKRWLPQSYTGGLALGLSVASNNGQFPARSAVATVFPRAAGNGFFYVVGQPERSPDDDFANPIVVRYRFVVPQGRAR